MIKITYNIYNSYASTFKEALAELLPRIDVLSVPVRVVVFGNPLSQEQYATEKYLIEVDLFDLFGDRLPLVTYVAQPPLAATLVIEVQSVSSDTQVEFKEVDEHRYAVLSGEQGVLLLSGGVSPVDLGAPIKAQSREVFAIVGQMLEREGLSVNDISRQWNYIEQITQIRQEHQNYQEFNDARTEFYSTVDWAEGYPAATGIGTTFGGVMVEIDAGKRPAGKVVALDNSLQVAAHEYSKDVLLGSVMLSTPKFERAKAIDNGDGSVKIYISGTAAIRGEQSLTGIGIKEQTVATLENIEWLVGRENMAQHSILVTGEVKYKIFRVYLKFRSDYLIAREIIEKRYGSDLPVVYVLTDVCRDELLIEIEGIARY